MQVFDQKIKLFLSNSAKCWTTEHFFCNTLQNIWHQSNQSWGLFLYEPSCFYRFCLVFIYKRMALRELEIFKWVCFLKEWRAFIISYGVIRIIGMLIGWIGSNWILLLFTNVNPFSCYIWVLLYQYFDPSHFLTIQAVALNSSGLNGMLSIHIGLLLDLWEAFLSKR